MRVRGVFAASRCGRAGCGSGMVKAPTMGPASGGPAGIRRIHPGPEIAMNPRNLPTASASMPPAMRGDANAAGRTTPVYHPQVPFRSQLSMIDVFMSGKIVIYIQPLNHRIDRNMSHWFPKRSVSFLFAALFHIYLLQR